MDPFTVAVIGIFILMVLGYFLWQFVFSIVIDFLVANGMNKFGAKLESHINAAVESEKNHADVSSPMTHEPQEPPP